MEGQLDHRYFFEEESVRNVERIGGNHSTCLLETVTHRPLSLLRRNAAASLLTVDSHNLVCIYFVYILILYGYSCVRHVQVRLTRISTRASPAASSTGRCKAQSIATEGKTVVSGANARSASNQGSQVFTVHGSRLVPCVRRVQGYKRIRRRMLERVCVSTGARYTHFGW